MLSLKGRSFVVKHIFWKGFDEMSSMRLRDDPRAKRCYGIGRNQNNVNVFTKREIFNRYKHLK